MSLFRLVMVLFGIMLLSGCSGLGGETINSISTKHDGSLIGGNGKKTSVPTKNCSQWCHNGWCSTHCEPITTEN